MIQRGTSIFLALFFFTVFKLYGQAKVDEWEQVAEQDGVRAYVMQSDESPFKTVRVTARIKTTFSALVSVTGDDSNQENWIYANSYSKIIRRMDIRHWVYYGISDAPWPVSDRDVVTTVSLEQDTVTGIISIVSIGVPNYIDHKEDYVRIPKLYSKWTFTPSTNGYIDVEFYLIINLGGNIPAWLVNDAVSKGPFQTIISLSEQLNKPKYKNASLPHIIEAVNFV